MNQSRKRYYPSVKRTCILLVLVMQIASVVLMPLPAEAQNVVPTAPQTTNNEGQKLFLPLISSLSNDSPAIIAPSVPTISSPQDDVAEQIQGFLQAGVPGTAQLVNAEGVVFSIKDDGAHLLPFNQQTVLLKGVWGSENGAPLFMAQSVEPLISNASGHAHIATDLIPTIDQELALVAQAENEKIGQNLAAENDVQAAAVSNVQGRWGNVQNWPVVPIFVSLLSDGRVLAYDSVGDAPAESYTNHTFTRATVWNPQTIGFSEADVGTGSNLFCSGFASMPDGRLFVAGGNANAALAGINKTHIFEPLNNAWSQTQNMSYARWYPAVTPLANGEMLITGGGPAVSEVRQTNGQIRQLTSGAQNYWANRDYPWLQAAPNGNVAFLGPGNQLGYVSTGGTGGWQSTTLRDNVYRNYGSYVMYDIGKVLVAGGGYENTSHSQRSARIIDLNNNTVSSTNAMALRRRQHNLTVLADGTVLATGGITSNAGLVDLNNAAYAAELWNPSTGQWTTMASESRARQYHSTALLLPDGRVLSAGGGICGDCQTFGYIQKNGQIFSPPYLFKNDASGQLATRPTYSGTPSSVAYGQSFTLSTAQASQISKVGFVRIGSVTHSQNMEQRYIPLSYTVEGNGLRVSPPANANIAPPGHYMLFIIDAAGVPSEANIVQIGNNSAPTIVNPGNQSSQVGQAVTLTLNASDPNGDAVTFSAVGLPTGLSLSSNTISGSPIAAGNFNVTITVNDGFGGVNNTFFTWAVTAAPPTNVAPVITNPGNQTNTVGQNVTVNLSASDADGDSLTFSATGLPAGLSLSNSSIGGSPTAAGTFNVNIIVNDGNGGSDSASFTWTVNDQPVVGVPIPVYQDVVASGWTTGNWSPVTVNLNNSSIVAAGSRSIALTYSSAYSTFYFLSGTALDAVVYQALQFQVYGTANNQQFKVSIMNSAYQTSQSVTIMPTPNQWQTVTIPLSELGSPGDILYILISNPISQAQPVFYLDEVVLIGDEGSGPTNQPPVLTSPGPQSSQVGQGVNLTLSASDPDGDALTFSASGLPNGLSVSGSTISGIPTTTGTYNVTITASDGNGGSDSASFTWTVSNAPPTNRAPTLTNPGNKTNQVGQNVNLALSASDPDGDTLTFSASGLPNGLSLGGTVINGSPTVAGTFNVTVIVNDGNGGSDSVSFTWTVNDQPVVGVPIPLYQDTLASGWSTGNWASVGINLNQSAIVAAGSRAIGLSFDGAYSTFFFLSGTPLPAANYQALRFQVYGTTSNQQFKVSIMNSAYQTSQAVTVTPTQNQWKEVTVPFSQLGSMNDILYILISNPRNQTQPIFYLDEVVLISDGDTPPTNQPPSITSPGNQSSQVGTAVNLSVNGTDPDGDSLTFSASGLPTGLSMNGSTISGSPTAAGTFNITVTANDGNGGLDSVSFTWTVSTAPPTNAAPVLSNPGNQSSSVGQDVNVSINASDSNGDPLTFGANGLPNGLSVSGSAISGSPTAAGTFNVTVTVNDGNGGSDSASFVWTVSDQPVVGVPIPIYQDAVASGWSTGNWSPATVDLNHSTIVATGSRSIAVKYDDAYSTFFFLSGVPLDATDYQAVRFQVYGTTSNQSFKISIMNSAYQTSQSVTITPISNQWQEVTIPLNQLGTLDDILYLLISNPSNQAQPPFYLDELVFVGN